MASITSLPIPQLASERFSKYLEQLNMAMMALVSWNDAVLQDFFDTYRSLLFKIRRLIGTQELFERDSMSVAMANGLALGLFAKLRLVSVSLRSCLNTFASSSKCLSTS